MMGLRKVVVYDWQRVEGKTCFEKVAIGSGVFHQFGVYYEEFETGPGNYSTAIVEMPDGTIQNVPVEMVVFNKPEVI